MQGQRKRDISRKKQGKNNLEGVLYKFNSLYLHKMEWSGFNAL